MDSSISTFCPENSENVCLYGRRKEEKTRRKLLQFLSASKKTVFTCAISHNLFILREKLSLSTPSVSITLVLLLLLSSFLRAYSKKVFHSIDTVPTAEQKLTEKPILRKSANPRGRIKALQPCLLNIKILFNRVIVSYHCVRDVVSGVRKTNRMSHSSVHQNGRVVPILHTEQKVKRAIIFLALVPASWRSMRFFEMR